jgi:hypothetical protein
MKNKNLQKGFAPLIIIAIVAVLAIGGGATYVANKNKVEKKVEVEGNLDTQANFKADENANENANLGINANAKAKGSLRSLLDLGQNTKCTFSSTTGDTTSTGTVYIASDGDMSGQFEMKTGTKTTFTSNMIIKDDISYVWSGGQGAKMNVADLKSETKAEGATGASEYVDLDAQVDYDCSAWVRDESKFTVPSTVNFIDLDAFLKGGIKLPGAN